MRYYCNICKKTITRGEYDYSKNHFNRPLCRIHQHSQKTQESDIGDIITKITEAFTKVYEKGGIGLVLTILGIVMFILIFIFRTAMPISTFVVLTCIAVISFVFGAIVLYKKEKKNN
ncbi:hypothetical protein GOV12_07870 [Candidatus Pacearchaeota archaeon]|nr:hypothetical protein [Candidatus Pacearchaeota archaeon]